MAMVLCIEAIAAAYSELRRTLRHLKQKLFPIPDVTYGYRCQE